MSRHAPPTQACACGQAFPHAPQWAESRDRSTHVPAQSARVGAQETTQTPFRHCLPGLHEAPHAPQFEGSLESSVHRPLHAASPAWQVS